MNLPNQLTVARIIMIPIFMIIMCVPPDVLGSWEIFGISAPGTSFIAATLFAVASLTDFLDGYIARKHHLVTNFGKFADPLADKMLVMTAFIILVERGQVSAWIVSIIVCRELAVTGLRLLLVGDGEVLAAAMPGKIKTATQMVAIFVLLLGDFPLALAPFSIGEVLLYICLFFTIYSGVDYFMKNKHVFADSFE